MNPNLNVFVYEGSKITFNLGNGDVMVNATEMARAFNKRPAKWLELPSTHVFLQELASVRKSDISENQLIATLQGSPENGGGTWMHEDVALEFARWLSPAFAIWCNDQIKILLKQGYTHLANISKSDLARLILESEAEKDKIQSLLEQEQATNRENAPKILFTDAVMGSKSSCLIGELAKLITQNGYPIGQNRLFAWMRDNGYMGKRGENYNIPLQQYVEQGLFELKKGTRSGNDGVMYTTITPKVTGKGQIYFVNKFLNNKLIA